MSHKKQLVTNEDGSFLKDENGHFMFICEFPNCQQPVKAGFIKCEKHINKSITYKSLGGELARILNNLAKEEGF